MTISTVYYLCKIGTVIAPDTGTVYQNNGSFSSMGNSPKVFSSKNDGLTELETLPNGEYYFVERYFKS